jgi:hypothetical protein
MGPRDGLKVVENFWEPNPGCPINPYVYKYRNLAHFLKDLMYTGWKANMEIKEWFRTPPLWSSDQSSWLQIQRSEFDFRRYQIFLEVVGLERGQLSLVSTIGELLGRKSSGSGLEIREYGRRDPSR